MRPRPFAGTWPDHSHARKMASAVDDRNRGAYHRALNRDPTRLRPESDEERTMVQRPRTSETCDRLRFCLHETKRWNGIAASVTGRAETNAGDAKLA